MNTLGQVNVLQLGALGNGIQDDAPAIQATLDSLPPKGGIRSHRIRLFAMLLSFALLIVGSALPSQASTSFVQSSRYVNVRSYGAKGDAITNDTAAIRKAVEAAKSGGKTVFFPAGLYKITESITIPAGVDLEGITSATNGPWQNLYDGESKGVMYLGRSSKNYFDPEMNLGSWILTANGRDNVDAGATFQLSGDNTVKKIGFINLFAPPVDESGTTPSPPAIGADINKLTSTKGITIEDISLSNPYYGIAVYQGSLKNYNTSSKLSGKGSGPVVIRNIMGAAMYRGISIIGVKDSVQIDNVQFNYANYGSAYIQQHWNYCVDIDIAASSDVTVKNVLSYGAYTGLQTSSAFSGSAVNVKSYNLNVEGERPLVLNASGTQHFSNSYILLTHFANASIKNDWAGITIKQDTASSGKAEYSFTNFVFQDPIGGKSLFIDATVQGGAKILMKNAIFWNWNSSTSSPMIKFHHASGSSSSFEIINLALATNKSGLLASVSGAAYKTGELTFKNSRFPADVLSAIDTSSGAPVKFINCTRYSNGNVLFSN